MTGRHSTILKPDSVSRVIPPTTIIPKTKVAEKNSHLVTAGPDRGGSSVVSGVALPEDSNANGDEKEVKKLQQRGNLAVNVLELELRLSTKRAFQGLSLRMQGEL